MLVSHPQVCPSRVSRAETCGTYDGKRLWGTYTSTNGKRLPPGRFLPPQRDITNQLIA